MLDRLSHNILILAGPQRSFLPSLHFTDEDTEVQGGLYDLHKFTYNHMLDLSKDKHLVSGSLEMPAQNQA